TRTSPGSHLDQADMTGALIGWTVFSEVDLSRVIGLETTRHSGPSSVGIDILYLSKGKIPEEFMRGAGISETLITFAKSLVGRAIEFYSCFYLLRRRNLWVADGFRTAAQDRPRRSRRFRIAGARRLSFPSQFLSEPF